MAKYLKRINLIDSYIILKDIFGSEVAIFIYGLVIGFVVSYKVRLMLKPNEIKNEFCVFTSGKLPQHKVVFQVHFIKNKPRIFCKNLDTKTHLCKTLHEPCTYAKEYNLA